MRVEKRIFGLNDEILALRRDEELAVEELIMHQHLNDDAQRDAVVHDTPMDRADVKETSGDVERMERHVAELRTTREGLETKRDRLLRGLGN
jgi:hypothetical protein